jgi:hypothetical protein
MRSLSMLVGKKKAFAASEIGTHDLCIILSPFVWPDRSGAHQ